MNSFRINYDVSFLFCVNKEALFLNLMNLQNILTCYKNTYCVHIEALTDVVLKIKPHPFIKKSVSVIATQIANTFLISDFITFYERTGKILVSAL